MKKVDLTENLYRYIVEHSLPLDDVQRDLIEETAALGGVAGMQIDPVQGQFLTAVTRLVDARFAVEVGTFTGYSSICIARGLAPGGRLLCCDVNEEWTAIARRYWERAGLTDRIELRLAPALETLRALPDDARFDVAFIDADKDGYPAYWDELVPRLRTNGVVLVDNTLWDGEVGDPDKDSDSLRAIREFNDKVAADDRVDVVLLPLADGMSFARVR
jgi:caffeoyl-CoA O-methyltransferase